MTSTPDITPAGYATGETVTYRITVSNNGIADAANVQLTETLDAALAVQSLTPSQGSCSGTTCNLGTITTTQAPVTIDVQAVLPGDLLGGLYPSGALLNNTATVSAPVGTEINPDDNSASATISTLPFADISLTKSFSPAQPVAGGPVTYTLIVHSDGPGTVDVVAADLLPAALQKPPTALSISGGTGVCRFDPTGESLGAPPGSDFPIVACDIPQFGPGEDRVITYTATLAPDSAGTPVTNSAFAGAVVPFTDLTWDPDNFADNTASVTFTPGTVDVGISKSVVGSSTVAVGDVATFQLVASNSGTVAAQNVVVTDTLPARLEPVDLPAGCLAAGQQVSCALGTLGPGSEQTIDVRARAGASAAARTLTNSASIRSDEADLVPGNDTSSADITVGPLASPPPAAPPAATPVDLAVTVEPPSGLATVGIADSWTLRVVNNGPGTATNVTLTTAARGAADSLGARAAAACLTAPGVRCGLGTLAPGASRTVVVTLRPTAAGRLTLAGRVTAAEQDAVPPNDTDEATVTVGLASVALSASAQPPVLDAGGATTIAITARTRGRRPVRNARVCVRVPKVLTVARPKGATLRGGRLCWRIARLAKGGRRGFRLRAVAPRVRRARSVVLRVTVQGAGVRTRRARVVLHVRPAPARPPSFTG